MRVTNLLITIGAALGFASADVICNTEALQHVTQVIADSTTNTFDESVEDLCGSENDQGIIESQFGSIVLSLNRTCSDCDSICVQQIDSIVTQCVISRELGGGIATSEGMTVEISIDKLVSDGSRPNPLEARTRKSKSRAKLRTKQKKTKSKAKKTKKTNFSLPLTILA